MSYWGLRTEERTMAIDRIPWFVVLTSGGKAAFALNASSPPLWVIDIALLTGTPSSSSRRAARPHFAVQKSGRFQGCVGGSFA